ncbi:hypothetical protein DLAC_00960 [Tieghemostelium lacteum]|uniref:Sister chromatid cohesion protein DCC1 n=1 Tax=Tieghemostelium lacteum TaxID=361077 RepID=A0A152A7H9_TIELA|nr:hypothetical protein DLAC_00960 [Tieghemostelium lacteum]|eukprot:KYR02156.1 hypothetical protein DLAC_00960 [Tieghemostelium lacteum]
MIESNQQKQLKFPNEFPNDDYKLLEVTPDILDNIKIHSKLTIKGSANEEAVLCTSNKTFTIKSGQTSNSLLLVGEKNEITSILHSQLELIETKPRLNTLLNVFQEGGKGCLNSLSDLYSESDDTQYDTQLGVYLHDLFSSTQASDSEILQYLHDNHCFQLPHNKRYIKLSKRVEYKLIDLVLSEITINSFQLDDLPIPQLLSKMSPTTPTFLIDHLLKKYSTKTGEKVALNLHELSITRAKQILTSPDTKPSDLQLNQFMELWKDKLPSTMPLGFPFTFDLIKSIAIIITDSKQQKSLKYIDETSLSQVPKQRFRELFSISNKWKITEIEPFIKNIIPPQNSLEQFVLKFSRPINSADGEKLLVLRD